MRTLIIFITTTATWVFKFFFAFLIMAPMAKLIFNPLGFSWPLYGFVLLGLLVVYLICLGITFVFIKLS